LSADRKAISLQFGRNLRRERGRAELTQARLAKATYLSRKDIWRLENGLNCPRLDTAVKLADALGVQMRDLLHGIE
jgi:DNA-binding XRE family transcriptional regulator